MSTTFIARLTKGNVEIVEYNGPGSVVQFQGLTEIEEADGGRAHLAWNFIGSKPILTVLDPRHNYEIVILKTVKGGQEQDYNRKLKNEQDMTLDFCDVHIAFSLSKLCGTIEIHGMKVHKTPINKAKLHDPVTADKPLYVNWFLTDKKYHFTVRGLPDHKLILHFSCNDECRHIRVESEGNWEIVDHKTYHVYPEKFSLSFLNHGQTINIQRLNMFFVQTPK